MDALPGLLQVIQEQLTAHAKRMDEQGKALELLMEKMSLPFVRTSELDGRSFTCELLEHTLNGTVDDRAITEWKKRATTVFMDCKQRHQRKTDKPKHTYRSSAQIVEEPI
ncbi:hypothetical protein Q1695_015146 [Nippostrongylus brasiliensis]|nr:hypothetical protein Q1695_015146 [Nippostrongylus brasiliensis]